MRNEKQIGNLFERLANHIDLLPPEIEEMRKKIMVIERLPVKGREVDERFTQRNTLLNLEDFDNQPDIIDEISVSENESFLLWDKTKPHALNEIMIISKSTEIIPNLFDHSSRFINKVFDVMGQFTDYARADKLVPSISWSYDPMTHDRESGQSEKRFHAHLIARSQDEVNKALASQKPLSELSHIQQRRIVDEAIIVNAMVAYDFLKNSTEYSTVNFIPPLSGNCLTPALFFEIKNGWETFKSGSFREELGDIYDKLEKLYQQLLPEVTAEKENTGDWQRPRIIDSARVVQNIDRESYDWMSETTRETFLKFLSGLENRFISEQRSQFFKKNQKTHRAILTYVYPLGGFSCNISFCEMKDGKVQGQIRLPLFSDMGSAGMTFIQGVPTKIKRGVGENGQPENFNNSELEQRRKFQHGFRDFLEKNKI